MGTRSKDKRDIAKISNKEFIQATLEHTQTSILPPPEDMKEYETIYPGITRILIDTYTSQVNHRINLETIVVEGDNKRANRGQIISAILAFVCIGLGGFLIYQNKNIGGLALIFGSLGTLLTAFYGGAIIRKNERIKKNQQFPL